MANRYGRWLIPLEICACVTDREQKLAERAGFSCAFLNVGGGLGAPMPRFALPRVHISGAMNLGEFEAHVSGFYRSLRQRFLGSESSGTIMGLREQTAPVETKAANLLVYRNPEVVSHYASLDYLTPCERHLFDTYLTPGMAILDMGVGGGRTTPYLSQKASRYVGIDYSEEMVRLCRDKFPRTEFLVADASDLSAFSDGSFDAIVFSFNGLDYFFPEEQRWKCLQECWRVLRAGGVFVFSSHNPRAVLVRPAWDRERLRAFAGKLVPERGVLFSADAVDSYRGEGAAFFLACNRAISRTDLPEGLEKSFLAGRRPPVRSRPWRIDDALLDTGAGP